MLEAQKPERSRVAREWHDETRAALTAILLDLTPIDGAATLADAARQRQRCGRTRAAHSRTFGRLAISLRPAALDAFGLAAAAKDLSSRLEELFLLTCDCPRSSKTAIFRIAQETLAN